jgi:hypothetical protein
MKKLSVVILFLFVLCAFGSMAYSQEMQIVSFNYSSSTEGYSLDKGSGDRTFTVEITFPKPFEVKPEVFLNLNTIDASNSSNLRVSMKAISISRDGFTIQIKTWGDSKINIVGGNYIALAPKK